MPSESKISILKKLQDENQIALVDRKHVCTEKCKVYHELIIQTIQLIADGMEVSVAIKKMRLSRNIFYHHLTEELSDALKRAKSLGPVAEAEKELYRRGIKGFQEPLSYQGRLTGDKVTKKSDTLLLAYLNANNQSYRQSNSPSITINNQTNIAVIDSLTQQTEEEKAFLNHLSSRGLLVDAASGTLTADNNVPEFFSK